MLHIEFTGDFVNRHGKDFPVYKDIDSWTLYFLVTENELYSIFDKYLTNTDIEQVRNLLWIDGEFDEEGVDYEVNFMGQKDFYSYFRIDFTEVRRLKFFLSDKEVILPENRDYLYSLSWIDK